MAVLINPGLMPVTLIPARAYSIAKVCATFLIVASAKSPKILRRPLTRPVYTTEHTCFLGSFTKDILQDLAPDYSKLTAEVYKGFTKHVIERS